MQIAKLRIQEGKWMDSCGSGSKALLLYRSIVTNSEQLKRTTLQNMIFSRQYCLLGQMISTWIELIWFIVGQKEDDQERWTPNYIVHGIHSTPSPQPHQGLVFLFRLIFVEHFTINYCCSVDKLCSNNYCHGYGLSLHVCTDTIFFLVKLLKVITFLALFAR